MASMALPLTAQSVLPPGIFVEYAGRVHAVAVQGDGKTVIAAVCLPASTAFHVRSMRA